MQGFILFIILYYDQLESLDQVQSEQVVQNIKTVRAGNGLQVEYLREVHGLGRIVNLDAMTINTR